MAGHVLPCRHSTAYCVVKLLYVVRLAEGIYGCGFYAIFPLVSSALRNEYTYRLLWK